MAGGSDRAGQMRTVYKHNLFLFRLRSVVLFIIMSLCVIVLDPREDATRAIMRVAAKTYVAREGYDHGHQQGTRETC